jgi:hypothetical protein
VLSQGASASVDTDFHPVCNLHLRLYLFSFCYNYYRMVYADPELRLKWCVAIRRENEKTKKLWEPYKTATICGKHFKPTDYKEIVGSLFAVTGRTRRVLNPGTVPSIFEHLTPKNSDAAEKRRDRAQRRQEEAPCSARSQTATCSNQGDFQINFK